MLHQIVEEMAAMRKDMNSTWVKDYKRYDNGQKGEVEIKQNIVLPRQSSLEILKKKDNYTHPCESNFMHHTISHLFVIFRDINLDRFSQKFMKVCVF